MANEKDGVSASVKVPANHHFMERAVIKAVRDGELEIDSDGCIWRLALRHGLKAGGSHLTHCERRRAEKVGGRGYLLVRAMWDGRRYTACAHRLVWQYFYGDIPDGLTINHKNGQKVDNRPANLEVATYSENMKHAYGSGLLDEHGERNPASTISDAHVEEIRCLYATGNYTQVYLGKMFDTCFGTISKLIRGERRTRQAGATSTVDHRHNVCERDMVTGKWLPHTKVVDQQPAIVVI